MKKDNLKNGFTFIELIIVFFVLTVGVLGVFRFVQYPISRIPVNESQLAATYLAQEGMELVRNMRDTNFLKGDPYNTGLDDCANGCIMDYDDTELTEAIGLHEDEFLHRDGNGFYNYSGGVGETKFQRVITITSAADHLEVKVEVPWKHKGEMQDPVVIQENIYPWWE